jgi:hypothetical protein
MVHSKTPHEWLVYPAPESRDIIWSNLALTFAGRSVRLLVSSRIAFAHADDRKLVINISTFLLIFFFMIPIAFVQSVVNINELSARLPFLEFVR